MTELKSADDFDDDGGTPGWRRRQKEVESLNEYRRQSRRWFKWRYKELTGAQCVGWFFVFPLLVLPIFYGTSLFLTSITESAPAAMLLAGAPWLAVIAGRITTQNKNPRKAKRPNYY